MKKQADYIKRIEIKGMWGRKNISWDLRADVNILSGVNGIGKSTILNNSVRSLTALEGGALTNDFEKEGVSFVFSPEDATYINFDVIRSFDRPLISSGLLEKIGNQNVQDRVGLAIVSIATPVLGLSGEYRKPHYRNADQRDIGAAGTSRRSF